MNQSELSKILKEHQKWLVENGGTRANLTGADLTRADLTRANLTRADLTGADLTRADLTGANLTGADLTGADLTWADLTWANLTGANLTRANLTRANLTSLYLPPPTWLLLCDWGGVSDKLTLELMRYDASNHPDPSKFDKWAKGNKCPYGKGFQRCANFKEKRDLWKSGKAKSARELMLMLFKEKNIKFDDDL
jgi:hypothetical protein